MESDQSDPFSHPSGSSAADQTGLLLARLFSLRASAHPVTTGPENLQCPAGSIQSL